MRWPLHPRRRAQDPAARALSLFAAAQSSGEKRFIPVCSRDGGDTLPQLQLAGCFGEAGKLGVHLSLLFRSFSMRQGASPTISVSLWR